MSRAADDLSGDWRGIFNYPGAGGPPTEFTAALTDSGGVLTGSTEEPSRTGAVIAARIDGRRTGSAVTFMKLYDENQGDYDAVAYEGSVDADGLEITGRWSIPGDWSGTFIMVRESGVEEEASAEAEQELP